MNISNSTDSPVIKHKPRNKALLAWMIISQILAIIPILALGGFGIFGILLDGTISLRGFVQFLSPLFTLIPLVAAWFAYAKRNEKLAWILTSIPILYTCLVIVVIWMPIFL